MVKNFQPREKYDFADLVGIMKLLRGEGGCPWDREQTHESIRSDFIEETYEAVEAIDLGDEALLREELGDVLLQVVFHAQIECEKGSFDIGDVTDGICRKLIIRHPHVFGDVKVDNTEQLLKNWDEIKRRTKGQETKAQALSSVPRALPALMRSCKVQQRASRSGYDWHDARGALDKTGEELEELREAVDSGAGGERVSEELGDLLFSAVNAARLSGVEPEKALTQACDKFIARFAKAEELAQGRDLGAMTDGERDELWEKAKKAL
jgi:tetrapyrrole methylase family protein/MazG family protein